MIRGTMSVCTKALTRLLFLSIVLQNCQGTRSPEETCQPGYYWKEGCQDCPLTCETCESNTTCTLCKIGYYGQDCLEKCQCKGEGCDKVTGYCHQGCVHGRYGKECKLPCPGCGTCKTCDRNTGQCVKCLDNYFLHDGKCRPCRHGCISCVTDSKCLQCEESYFLLDGRCERCMHGCRLCNTSNNCMLCNNDSIALFDGFCLSRCPANTIMIPANHGLSTCEEHSYSYNYKERGFCQQQSNTFPFAEFTCIYQCSKSCDSISCQSTCIVHKRKQQQKLSRNEDREPALRAARTNAIVGCLNYQFMDNGSCHPCPTDCKRCVSKTSCTLCNRGLFGTVCEKKCDTNCTGICHKQYGHCTHGCPDGTYPADDNSCQPCWDHCLLCASSSECILYEDEACRQSCPGNCTKCDTSTGKCLQCLNVELMKQNSPESSLTSVIAVVVVIAIVIAIVIIMWVFRGKWYYQLLQTITNWKGMTVKKNFPKEEPEPDALPDEAVTRKVSVDENVWESNVVIRNEKTTEEAEEIPFIDEGISSSCSSRSNSLEERKKRCTETEQPSLSERLPEAEPDSMTPMIRKRPPASPEKSLH